MVTLDFVLRCGLLGHRYRFRAEGATMHWTCERGCGAAGSKEYPTAAEAARYAAAFDREDTDELGRRAPALGMFPLRIWWSLRSRGARRVWRNGARRRGAMGASRQGRRERR